MSRDTRSWVFAVATIVMTGVGAGIIAAGLPAGVAGVSTVSLLVVAALLSVVALSGQVRDLRVVVPALIGVGLCGAGLDWQADGPGFVAGYVSLVGLGLRAPRRVALFAGIPVVAAIAVAETFDSTKRATTSLAVLSASGLILMTSAFAAISLDARRQAEALLAQQAATGEARQRAAALAERSRLARDLHDVLAHGLSALAVQLEATRLMAITSGAGARLVGQIASAHKLTCIGMLEARRALQMLREGEAPGPASVPALVSETSGALGIPITLEVEGVPRPLGAGAGITLYRVVQEALTNVAKHAGHGARVTVRLVWASGGVEVSVLDRGGDGVDAGLPSSGFGLTSMAERAALNGGWLSAGHSDGGFAVVLRLPANPAAPEGPS
jgi:signal transduction histidine kinase